jgi:hypothetical protein
VTADLGFDFTLDLCAAIGLTTSESKLSDSGAFDYRGVDLAYAIERELYIELVNNASVRASYDAARAGAASTVATVGRPVESEVVRRLIPGGAVAISFPPSRARRIGRSLRDSLVRRGGGATSTASVSATGPILVLLHHPKFLDFVQPVLDRLDPANVVIASTHAGVGEIHLSLRRPVAPVPAALRGMHSPPAYDTSRALLTRLRPRTVLAIEGNHPWDEAVNRAARDLGLPCFCLQHGWSPIVHSGFRNMSFSELFVWGEGFAELLRPFNPDQRFTATGNPALAGTTSADAKRQLALVAQDRKLVAFFLQSTSQLISADQIASFQTLISEFVDRFPDAHALVREHPSAPLGEAERATLLATPGVTLIPPVEFPLRDVLAACRSTVSMYSTTILESIAMLVPPVVFNATSLPRYSPDVEAEGAGIEDRTRADVLETLDRLLHDDAYHASFRPALERFRGRFFASEVADPAGRIATVLEQAS